jgi:monothiol glutaredoxin
MSEIEADVKGQKVFLYMKGTPDFPQCGFSARVVQILQHLGAEFGSCDILVDPEKRDAVKVYGKWPTIPQLYIDGELVGGCDITTEMFQSGELQSLLGASK